MNLIDPGLNISTSSALDFIVLKAGNATKRYQRDLKNLEKDALQEIETKLEKAHDNESAEVIEGLKEEHKTILDQVCEREAVKLKTFKILHDEKPSKGMIALEKKLTG
jgi:cellobiose-specific phosphotransferase system component IIA